MKRCAGVYDRLAVRAQLGLPPPRSTSVAVRPAVRSAFGPSSLGIATTETSEGHPDGGYF